MIMKYLLTNNKIINKSLDYDSIICYLNYMLNKEKNKIDDYAHEWDKVKKIIHDYEYVYYSSYRKKNISIISPVSRSYFKLREMIYEYDIKFKNNYNTCHLAEAPGGFIQSIIHLIEKNKLNIYANSLLSDDKSIPRWNHKISKYKINYIYGKNNNGDLFDFLNIMSMIHKIGRNKCEFITGDGGFDFSEDYSKQEYNSLRLIYNEIFLALNIQKKNGNFICKIFDTFLKETIDLIYLLTLSYENVYLHKPKISRNSNSEKYLVCLNYKGYNKKIINNMCHSFNDLKLNLKLNDLFYHNLINYIIKYTLKQIKSINKGIDIINSKTYKIQPRNKQLILAINWCKKYNVRINERCIYLNNPS